MGATQRGWALKTNFRGSDETTTLSQCPTLAMTDTGNRSSRPVSTFYPDRSRDGSPSRRTGRSFPLPGPTDRTPGAPRIRDLRRRSPSPSSASAVSFGPFRLRLIPKSTDPTLLLDSDDDDFLPHARPEPRAQSPDHYSVSSSIETVLPWIPPADTMSSPPPQPPQRPTTPSPPTYSPPQTPGSSSTPSFQTAPSQQPLTPKTTPHIQRTPLQGNKRPPAPALPLTPTSNKRKSTVPHTDDTSPSARFRRNSPPPLYPALPGIPSSIPRPPNALPTPTPTPTQPDPFLSRPANTTPPPQHTLLSPPSFPSLIALWRGTPRDAEPPLPASGPCCPRCAGPSSLLRVGPLSANAGRPYYGCDGRTCRGGRRFVVWADLIGVGEGGDVECYCGEPARWSRTRRWDQWWDCVDGRCGFTRWGGNLEGEGRQGRAYC